MVYKYKQIFFMLNIRDVNTVNQCHAAECVDNLPLPMVSRCADSGAQLRANNF